MPIDDHTAARVCGCRKCIHKARGPMTCRRAEIVAALRASRAESLALVRAAIQRHDDGLAERKHGDILAHQCVSEVRNAIEETD